MVEVYLEGVLLKCQVIMENVDPEVNLRGIKWYCGFGSIGADGH